MIHDVFGPQHHQLLYGANGKPHVFMPSGKQIQVSLSHSNGLAAAALALDSRIGVDIESLGRVLVP
jgi:phosphopantetheinyl transferase